MWESTWFGALALSFGWALRGTISGGMKGAMVAGAFIGLALALTAPDPALRESFALLTAVGAIGMSFGGCMTYGQTLGLTHNGNPPPDYWWGLLGTAVKGCVWIGLGGLVLGMASGYVRYGFAEWLGLIGAGVLLFVLGVRLLNRPMEPPERLPRIYFSQPDHTARYESWGGMWFLFLGWLAYAAFVRSDVMALSMAAFGLVGGLGFPIGQAIQSWGRRKSPFGTFGDQWIPWWKVMEFTFGAVAGALLGFGWWWSVVRYGPFVPISTWAEGAVVSVGVWAVAALALWLTAVAYAAWAKALRGRAATVWFFVLYLFLPLLGVMSGNLVWAMLYAGPLIIWIVGNDVPLRWTTLPGRPVLFALVWGMVGAAALLALLTAWTPALLWNGLVIAYTLLLVLHYVREAYDRRRAKALVGVGGFLMGLGQALPVALSFVLLAMVLLWVGAP